MVHKTGGAGAVTLAPGIFIFPCVDRKPPIKYH